MFIYIIYYHTILLGQRPATQFTPAPRPSTPASSSRLPFYAQTLPTEIPSQRPPPSSRRPSEFLPPQSSGAWRLRWCTGAAAPRNISGFHRPPRLHRFPAPVLPPHGCSRATGEQSAHISSSPPPAAHS